MNNELEALIRLNDVSVKYMTKLSLFDRLRQAIYGKKTGGREWALQNIQLELKKGDSLALIGRNGSGKTTLLKTMAQIYEPEKGSVHIGGSLASLYDLSLGFLPEDTGKNNVYRKLLLMGFDRLKIKLLLPEIIQFSELKDYIEKPVSTYSSGMRMRLAFATVTSVMPDILLMDEWISTGDKAFVDKVSKRLDTFIDNCELVVLASHSERLLKRVCNKGVVLNEGIVEYSGTVEESLDFYNRKIIDKKNTPKSNKQKDDLTRGYAWLRTAVKNRNINNEKYLDALKRSQKFLKKFYYDTLHD